MLTELIHMLRLDCYNVNGHGEVSEGPAEGSEASTKQTRIEEHAVVAARIR